MAANTGLLVDFTVGDAEQSPASLVVTSSSSDASLIPHANVVHGGADASRNVTVYPLVGQTGSSTITLTVDDGQATTSEVFTVTVTNGTASGNTPPSISSIPDQGIAAGASAFVDFTIDDAEQSSLALSVSGSSSNPSLIPDVNLVFGGAGDHRTLTATPFAGMTGTSTITVTVWDGFTTTDELFVLTVTNQPPVITAQPESQTVKVNKDATLNVSAEGTAPLSYQWYRDGSSPVGGDNPSLVLSSVQVSDEGDYHVVVSNSEGSETSAVATLTVDTNIAVGLFWIGGSSGGNMSDLDNYAVNEDGSGGPPGAINSGDVIEYTADSGSVNQQISQAVTLSFGAFHNNTNTTGSGYIWFNGSAGSGTWTLNGATVAGLDSVENAVFINDQERGFNFKADVVLAGGGDFVFLHRSGSGGEYQGNSFGETGGAANLVFQGANPVGRGGAVHLGQG